MIILQILLKKNKNFRFKADYSFVLGENDLHKYSNFVSEK